MSYQYSLTIVNNSAHSDSFMLFQNDPGSFAPNAMAIAWFTKYSNPGPNVTVKFTWQVDWGFSWADTGTLAPGVIFSASDTRSASPSTNMIPLSYNGAYRFGAQTAGPDPTRFYIAEDGSIPVSSSASVGITMSGSTVYAAQARPNTNITATPHPQYFVAYGSFEPGQVIDISTVNNPLRLDYQPGIYSLSTVLHANDTWAPPVTAAARNTAFLAAREKNPKLRWSDDF
jgi:hypothetical protein